jgi:hypothetical protein
MFRVPEPFFRSPAIAISFTLSTFILGTFWASALGAYRRPSNVYRVRCEANSPSVVIY